MPDSKGTMDGEQGGGPPSHRKTGRAEKMQSFPSEQVMTMTMIRSRIWPRACYEILLIIDSYYREW